MDKITEWFNKEIVIEQGYYKIYKWCAVTMAIINILKAVF